MEASGWNGQAVGDDATAAEVGLPVDDVDETYGVEMKQPPSFETDGVEMKQPPSFETHGVEMKQPPSFETDGVEMKQPPSFEGDATMNTPCFEGVGETRLEGYKRHNPRERKKKTVRGGLGSKRLFQRPSPPGPSQALAQLTPASAGLAPCITPLPNSQDANMNPRQLKRKVRDMEAKELKLTDKVIELEVVLKNKNETIKKHLKRIRLLTEKNSEDRKACNLVSLIQDY
jgi:hypothetical protein